MSHFHAVPEPNRGESVQVDCGFWNGDWGLEERSPVGNPKSTILSLADITYGKRRVGLNLLLPIDFLAPGASRLPA